MAAGTITVEVQYKPGPLVRLMCIARQLGVRFPTRFVVWAMQHSGYVRLGSGPWLPVRPNLRLGGG